MLKEFQLSSFWCEDLLEGFSHSNTLRSRDQNLWTGGGVADFYYKGGVSSFCLMSWPCSELGPDVVFLSLLFQHDFNINVQASINNCIKKTCSSSFIVQSWCIITDTVPLAKKLTNLRFRSKTHRGKMWRSHWITSQFGLLQFFNVVCSSLVTHRYHAVLWYYCNCVQCIAIAISLKSSNDFLNLYQLTLEKHIFLFHLVSL